MFAIQPIEPNSEEIREPEWQEFARCNDGTGSMTELFFSEQLDDIAAAKAFCLECPVREPCLEGARLRREPWGVWGGELFVNGKIVAQKRKRGRPRKVRPEEAAELPPAQSA
jgi:WhiB family redox-sensing transcriptional regulator